MWRAAGLGCFAERCRQRCLLRSTHRIHACLSTLRQDLAPEAEVPQAGLPLLAQQGQLQCSLQASPGEVSQVSCICMQDTCQVYAPAAQVTEPLRMVQPLAVSTRGCIVSAPSPKVRHECDTKAFFSCANAVAALINEEAKI